MLYLLFQIGDDRYAVDARQAVEVIPLLALKRIPQSPRGVAGILNYRGQPVPALDLCELTVDRPARERLSTRIILVNYSDSAGCSRQLGLIAEHATEMMRCEECDFVDSGMNVGNAPYLGPVLMEGKGIIQLIHASRLAGLAENVREMLPAEASDLSHESR